MSAYSWLMLLGIGVSLGWWFQVARRDSRLITIYLAALAGAFAGAKLVYILAEGYIHFGASDMWMQLATGKSILGGLLGGYAAVELVKPWVGSSGITGDWFATILPVGIMFGRVGCLFHGCCLGIKCSPAWFTMDDATGHARWPAVPVEMLFNLLAIIAFFFLRRARLLAGQHFHLYLIAYGGFRFIHEFLRDEPRIVAGLSGYQFAALAVLGLGVVGFVRRKATRVAPVQLDRSPAGSGNLLPPV